MGRRFLFHPVWRDLSTPALLASVRALPKLLYVMEENGSKFPVWSAAARVAFALSPNSAACERVFSMLERLYGEQQERSLADRIEVALMLAYNMRRIG